MTKSILLTGSSGFLGSRILQKSTHAGAIQTVSLQSTPVSKINFTGISTIVHSAGIAHRMEQTDKKFPWFVSPRTGNTESLYFKVNRDLTLLLAKAAKANRVKHFIFLSTIKVFGLDAAEQPISLDMPCRPNEPYGKSKWEAEEGLRKLVDKDFKVTIVRPPLIYGPGVKGNLLKLMHAIRGSGLLPLGGIENRRSMIFVDNLIALIDLIIEKKVSITITPTDQPALSTTQLVQHLAKTLNPNKKTLTIPVFLRPLIKILKPAFYHRLFGSLEVVPHPELEKLGYKQPHTVEEGLKVMAESFMSTIQN